MYEPPVPTTVGDKGVSIKAKYLEGILRPPKSPLMEVDYEPKLVDLRNGKRMIVRMATKDDAEILLEASKRMIDLDIAEDFFDIVAARVYSEVLAWVRERIKDEYIQIGVTENGVLAGLVNARLWDEEVAISLHSLVTLRRVGAGTPLYFAKMEHAFDNLDMEEWRMTAESYYGFRMIFLKGAGQAYPWPEYQYELGGARVFYNTKEQWNNYIKPSFEYMMGTRPVPDDLLEVAKEPELPDIEGQFE